MGMKIQVFKNCKSHEFMPFEEGNGYDESTSLCYNRAVKKLGKFKVLLSCSRGSAPVILDDREYCAKCDFYSD